MATMTTMRPAGISGYAQRARWATIRVETDGCIYVGRVYVPETRKRLSDMLCDERTFLNLTDVTINGSAVIEPFVALNKSFVKSVRVVSEDDAAAPRSLKS